MNSIRRTPLAPAEVKIEVEPPAKSRDDEADTDFLILIEDCHGSFTEAYVADPAMSLPPSSGVHEASLFAPDDAATLAPERAPVRSIEMKRQG